MERQRPRKFEDIDRLVDAGGVAAIITRTVSNNSLAVGFFKEFDPSGGEGEVERTAFMREKQLAAVERLIPLVRERLAELKEKYPPIQREAMSRG